MALNTLLGGHIKYWAFKIVIDALQIHIPWHFRAPIFWTAFIIRVGVVMIILIVFSEFLVCYSTCKSVKSQWLTCDRLDEISTYQRVAIFWYETSPLLHQNTSCYLQHRAILILSQFPPFLEFLSWDLDKTFQFLWIQDCMDHSLVICIWSPHYWAYRLKMHQIN